MIIYYYMVYFNKFYFRCMMEETPDIDMPYNELSFEELSTEDPAIVKEYTKKVLQRWREEFAAGQLTAVQFEELWKFCVPKIYSPTVNENCLNWNFNEDLAQDILFNTLDEFICNGDSATVLKRLGEMVKAPSVRNGFNKIVNWTCTLFLYVLIHIYFLFLYKFHSLKIILEII